MLVTLVLFTLGYVTVWFDCVCGCVLLVSFVCFWLLFCFGFALCFSCSLVIVLICLICGALGLLFCGVCWLCLYWLVCSFYFWFDLRFCFGGCFAVGFACLFACLMVRLSLSFLFLFV